MVSVISAFKLYYILFQIVNAHRIEIKSENIVLYINELLLACSIKCRKIQFVGNQEKVTATNRAQNIESKRVHEFYLHIVFLNSVIVLKSCYFHKIVHLLICRSIMVELREILHMYVYLIFTLFLFIMIANDMIAIDAQHMNIKQVPVNS